jgi:malate dehydrogenase
LCSQAYAGQTFTSRLLAAISGEPNVVECTFVENNLTPAPFFSTPVSRLFSIVFLPRATTAIFFASFAYLHLTFQRFLLQVRLGPNGVEEVLHYGTLSAAEQATLDAMIPDLVAQAKKGVEFVKASK